ncbi:hypothetical protein [Pararhodobacter sp. SW119]|uniref:hypothetical protein n=1 Tax=Pararhodobacter sp. SW119 TaxID=2780075 RepID=UPI001AE0AE5E|nr:hypothetical protein [Pararhodobacter sp. SW119]
MKIAIALAAFATAVVAQPAIAFDTPSPRADSRVSCLFGAGQVNEIGGPDDVRANPNGFYVIGLAEQIPLGDARIVFTNAASPHLCTRQSATPQMDTTNVILNANRRTTSWLFVPFHPMGW